MKYMRLFPLWILFIGVISSEETDPRFRKAERTGAEFGKAALTKTSSAITVEDLKGYVARLASKEFEGRCTGEPGEQTATAYFAHFLDGLGIKPDGDGGTFFQTFTFRSGMKYDGENSLTIIDSDGKERKFQAGDQFHPISVSASGIVEQDIVFAGFGIDHEDYDSFAGLDVKDKWILVLRGTPKSKTELRRFSPLYRKAEIAKQKGASGILYIKAENPQAAAELVAPSISIGPPKSILPAITITDKLAESLLQGEQDLKEIFDSYNKGKQVAGYAIPFRARAEVALSPNLVPGRNVIGRLIVGDSPADQAIVIGGHIDHLGFGTRGGSMARGERAKQLHPGADDNASGIAVVMELAQFFSGEKQAGRLHLERDLIFAAWSGEEIGIWGSRQFVKERRGRNDKVIYPQICAYINMDMVGRASNNGGLTLYGIDSSFDWRLILNSISGVADLPIKQVDNPRLPGDAEPFYLAGVPILAAFTGRHNDYHTPDDTADKIDFVGLGQVANYMKELVTAISNRTESPSYVQVPKDRAADSRKIRRKLGIRVRFDEENGNGVSIGEVLANSPAEKAGIKAGDSLIDIDESEPAKGQSLTAKLANLQPGRKYTFGVKRGKESFRSTVALDNQLIPFDDFYISVNTNDWRQPRGTGEALNVSVTVRRSDGDTGSASFEVNCFEFPAGQRMMPTEDRKIFLEACRAAQSGKPYDQTVETRSFRGFIPTRYQSTKVLNGLWMVRVSRADQNVLFSPKEGERLIDAVAEARVAMNWYRKLLNDEKVEPGKNAAPPKSESYYLRSRAGTVMAKNGELGIEISVDKNLDNRPPTVGYTLRFGERGSTGGQWVSGLIDQIGKAIAAAERGEEDEGSFANGKVIAKPDSKTAVVSVVPGEFFRDRAEKVSSFTRKDYQAIRALIGQTGEMIDWFTNNKSLFYTETNGNGTE